jgi:hypothetical protein
VGKRRGPTLSGLYNILASPGRALIPSDLIRRGPNAGSVISARLCPSSLAQVAQRLSPAMAEEGESNRLQSPLGDFPSHGAPINPGKQTFENELKTIVPECQAEFSHGDSGFCKVKPRYRSVIVCHLFHLEFTHPLSSPLSRRCQAVSSWTTCLPDLAESPLQTPQTSRKMPQPTGVQFCSR